MYPTPPDNKNQKTIASFILILAVIIVVGSVSAYDAKQGSSSAASAPATSVQTGSNETATTDISNTSDTSTSSTPSTATTSSSYKDGTYTASASYFVPHGNEDIDVTLTLQNGVVTDSQITNSESDPESARFQQDFVQMYKSYVVGKNISGLHLSYIAGASDTTDGFNTAVQKIVTQAQA
jgi:uncharacterized protein with FMN-binding domain